MRIIFFSTDNNASSGAFKAELNLINDLRKKGHDITIVLPYLGSGQKLVKLYKINYKIILSVFWVCKNPKNIFSFLFHYFVMPINCIASLRSKKFLKNSKCNLVVVNTLWNGIGGEQAYKLSIPVVWHFREMIDRQGMQFFNYKKSISIISKSSSILTVSNCVAEHYKTLFPKNNIKVIYDGVDINKFYYKNIIFKNNKVRILMVGRVIEQKAQKIALEALNELSQLDFEVLVVGHILNFYKKKMIKLIPNIKSKVKFCKPTTNIIDYYRCSDLFIMNATGEAFGLVTVEAMLSGLPVIVAKCDGSEEIVLNENYGYFYEPNNVASLKTKILDVFNNKERAKVIALNGQQRAKECFSKERNTEEIDKIYKSNYKKILN